MIDGLSEISRTLNSYGPVITIIGMMLIMNAFFVWRDFKREDRQQRQIEALQKTHNEVIIPLFTECKEAIASCQAVISQNSKLIEGWLRGGR